MIPDDLRTRAECGHRNRTGGNDYIACLDCGLNWDYRKETPDEVVKRDLLAENALLNRELIDIRARAHGEGQMHAIADVNAGLIDDMIAPRLEAAQAEIARLSAERDRYLALNIALVQRATPGETRTDHVHMRRLEAELSTLRAEQAHLREGLQALSAEMRGDERMLRRQDATNHRIAADYTEDYADQLDALLVSQGPQTREEKKDDQARVDRQPDSDMSVPHRAKE